MFVIPCKYTKKHNYIYNLISGIRKYHKDEKIVIVDSDSENKDYFELKDMYNNLEILDAKNKHYHVGGYWIAYDKYPEEDFYYFLHDSMLVKDNLDYLKEKDFTNFAYFKYKGYQHIGKHELEKYTPYPVPSQGYSVYGPCFFVKNHVMKTLKNNNVDKILPTYSQHSKVKIGLAAFAIESVYGIIFTNEGYDIVETSLIGSITQKGVNHFIKDYDSTWMFPIEKVLAKRA